MKETITIGDTQTEVSGEVDKVNVNLHKTIKEEQAVRIKLMKMSKGYQWEISAEGPDPQSVVSVLADADKLLRWAYSTEGE